jgi:hypothetical protein
VFQKFSGLNSKKSRFVDWQVLQLLHRYPNGITDTILHSESQSAFDEYRLLFTGSSRKQLRVCEIGGHKTDRDFGSRAVLHVEVVRVEVVPTLVLYVADPVDDVATLASHGGLDAELEDEDEAADILGRPATVSKFSVAGRRGMTSIMPTVRLLPCLLHQSFGLLLAPPRGSGLLMPGRRLRLTNVSFARTATGGACVGTAHSAPRTRLQLLPTQHLLLILTPWTVSADRQFLLTFAPSALRESFASLQLAIELTADMDEGTAAANTVSTLYELEYKTVAKLLVKVVRVGAVRASRNRLHKLQRRVVLDDLQTDRYVFHFACGRVNFFLFFLTCDSVFSGPLRCRTA